MDMCIRFCRLFRLLRFCIRIFPPAAGTHAIFVCVACRLILPDQFLLSTAGTIVIIVIALGAGRNGTMILERVLAAARAIIHLDTFRVGIWTRLLRVVGTARDPLVAAAVGVDIGSCIIRILFPAARADTILIVVPQRRLMVFIIAGSDHHGLKAAGGAGAVKTAGFCTGR